MHSQLAWVCCCFLFLFTVIFVKVKNDHRSKFSNLSNWKEEAWKNQGFNGIRTRDDHSSLWSATAVQIYELFHIYYTPVIFVLPTRGISELRTSEKQHMQILVTQPLHPKLSSPVRTQLGWGRGQITRAKRESVYFTRQSLLSHSRLLTFERNYILVSFRVASYYFFVRLWELYRRVCFLPNSEALKMRIRKLCLERTSVCYLTRPPSLVYDTAKTMSCNNNARSSNEK